MIYNVSKKILVLSALFLLTGVSFANFWSAEWRDEFMIRQEDKEFSCKMQDWACCLWNVCSQSTISCEKWNIPVLKWCSEKCTTILECKKSKTEGRNKEEIKKEENKKIEERKKEEKKFEAESNIKKEEIKKEDRSKLDKMDDNILKRFNIEKDKETEDDVKIKVRTVKIEKINNVSSKLENIIQETDNLNYDSSKLKIYVQNFKNIKYYLSQNNLTIAQTKQYNTQLKNTMNNIKLELSNIKKTYESD